ncbi:MAG: hypothetical protein F6K47_10680 [Symploca sp. SIO2E6]|nr:hypothetical protein [Symploca sp. SIO2E6]
MAIGFSKRSRFLVTVAKAVVDDEIILLLCLLPVISNPVESLHLGDKKADGRRQMAEGKEQGCKVEGYDKCLAGFDMR